MNFDLEEDRIQALTIACPLTACAAPAGEMCRSFVTGKPHQNLPAHNARLKAAGVEHAPVDVRELRHDPDRKARW